jgi:hypothetical protein
VAVLVVAVAVAVRVDNCAHGRSPCMFIALIS